MSEYTKGPWRWMKGAERGYRLHAGPKDGKQTLVLMTFPRQLGQLAHQPTEADCRLIAAAPELLDALRATAPLLPADVQEKVDALVERVLEGKARREVKP